MKIFRHIILCNILENKQNPLSGLRRIRPEFYESASIAILFYIYVNF